MDDDEQSDSEAKREAALNLATDIARMRSSLSTFAIELASIEAQRNAIIAERNKLLDELPGMEARFSDLLEGSTPSTTQRIVDHLAAHPREPFTADEIARALRAANVGSVRTILSRLEKAGRVGRKGPGLYGIRGTW